MGQYVIHDMITDDDSPSLTLLPEMEIKFVASELLVWPAIGWEVMTLFGVLPMS